MLKKEIIDTLKQTALVACFLAVIPVVFLVNSARLSGEQSFEEYVVLGLYLDFYLLVMWLAYEMFAGEDTDDSEDYLKTLPVTRWKLLAVKTLPRLAMVWAIGAVLNLTSVPVYDSLLVSVVFSAGVMLSGFLLGISNRRNPVLVAVFFAITTYPVLSVFVSYLVFLQTGAPLVSLVWNHWVLYKILDGLLLVVPATLPYLLLFPVFRSWDCSSKQVRSEKMLKRLALPAVAYVVIWAEVFTV